MSTDETPDSFQIAEENSLAFALRYSQGRTVFPAPQPALTPVEISDLADRIALSYSWLDHSEGDRAYAYILESFLATR